MNRVKLKWAAMMLAVVMVFSIVLTPYIALATVHYEHEEAGLETSSFAADVPPGGGTAANPYLVSSEAHLRWLAGLDTFATLGMHLRLVDDIDISHDTNFGIGGTGGGTASDTGFRGT